MRPTLLLAPLVLLAAAAHAEDASKYQSVDSFQSIWVDARLHGAFAVGSGGRPALHLLPANPEATLFRAAYGYQRGSVGFDLDLHLSRLDFGSALHVTPTPMFRLHFTFGGADEVPPLPTHTQLVQASDETGGLGYVLAIGNGVQVYRAKHFLLLAYGLVGLEGRQRWYAAQEFLWAMPMLVFGARALYETPRWRIRGGYEAQPPFFGRVEHRLELMVAVRPFEGGEGPFFGLKLFGHYGQTPVAEPSTAAPTAGMSELQGGVGLEVGL